MPRRNDNAPVGNTCPMIDDVIGFIHGIEWHEDSKDSAILTNNAIDSMEDIRGANQQLRDWGNDEYERAEELEKEVNRLENQIKELRAEIQDYENA